MPHQVLQQHYSSDIICHAADVLCTMLLALQGRLLLPSRQELPMQGTPQAVLASVCCCFCRLQGEVDVAIGPVSYPGLSSGLFAASPSGKPARSLFRVLHRHAASSLVEVSGGSAWQRQQEAARLRMVLQLLAPCALPDPVQLYELSGSRYALAVELAAYTTPSAGIAALARLVCWQHAQASFCCCNIPHSKHVPLGCSCGSMPHTC